MNLRQFDLNLLVALDALLAERSVTRAAERLALSQSAMSGMLSRARALFGDEILVRVGRRLEPTAFGVELAQPLRECICQLEDLLNPRAAFAPETESRLFLIASTDFIAFLMLGPLMRRLTELAPNICVRFVPLNASVEDRVASGEIDFLIVPQEIAPDLPSIGLFDDSWICATWSGNCAVGDSVARDEFLALRHLAFSPSFPSHTAFGNEFFTYLGFERKVAGLIESWTAVPFVLQGSSLVTMLPKRLGERLRQAADIRLVEPLFDIPPIHEKLLWSPRFTASPPHEWLRSQMIELSHAL